MILRLVVRRLLFLVLVLVGLSAITFVLSRVVPNDPARLMAGPRAGTSAVAKVREQYGLDRPLAVQYVDYVRGVVRLDFGTSFTSRRPVKEDLARYLPATIELGTYAFLLATVTGLPLGVLAALRRNTWVDHLARLVSITGLALPAFWLALVGQYLFFGRLGWLPDGQRLPVGVEPPPTVSGFYVVDALLTGDWATLRTAVAHLVLPVAVLAFGSLAIVTRMVRAGMLEVLNQDYVRTARAKGLTGRQVITDHVLKNGLLPAVTSLGLQIGLLLSGTFLVEIVFSWPGIGRYAVEAIEHVDYNAIVATTLVVAVVFALMNLVVDLLYLFLDPRISYESGNHQP